jgi:hypothetical protein
VSDDTWAALADQFAEAYASRVFHLVGRKGRD